MNLGFSNSDLRRVEALALLNSPLISILGELLTAPLNSELVSILGELLTAPLNSEQLS